MKLLLGLLPIFGVKRVTTEHYFLLCKNTNTGTIYFRCYTKGIADFTMNKGYAWKFKDPEDARAARIRMGLFQRDMYIEEIIK